MLERARNYRRHSPSNNAPYYQPHFAMRPRRGRNEPWMTLIVCKNFVSGGCRYSAENCKFAHPSEYNRIENGRVVPCLDFICGKCENRPVESPCPYYHPQGNLRHGLLRYLASQTQNRFPQRTMENFNVMNTVPLVPNMMEAPTWPAFNNGMPYVVPQSIGAPQQVPVGYNGLMQQPGYLFQLSLATPLHLPGAAPITNILIPAELAPTPINVVNDGLLGPGPGYNPLFTSFQEKAFFSGQRNVRGNTTK